MSDPDAPRVILDPSVYIAAGRSPQGSTHAFLVRGIDEGEYQIVWSQKLGYELLQTFQQPKQSAVIQPEWVEGILDDLDARGVLVNDPQLTNSVALAHDRDDDYLVALARQERVPLVTLDKGVLSHAPDDVVIIRPNQFEAELEQRRTREHAAGGDDEAGTS